ncbi:MAG: DUF503 domain-containing protein [Deltaproteobacteria bacterium]|nr:DUF503 domain-containing protein [Deltaproteobacteria bacterium]
MPGLVVGICKLQIEIEDNHSLKGKRSVVRRVKDRVRNTFNVAIAEVDDLDVHDSAILGFAVVGNDHAEVNSRIDRILGFIEDLDLAPVAMSDFEILHY